MTSQSSLERLVQWVIKSPWVSLGFSLVFVGLLSAGAERLKVQTDIRAFFAKDNEQVLSTELVETTFSKTTDFFIVVSPVNGLVFTSPVLQLIRDVTQQSWQLPFSNRVESVTNFQFTQAQGDTLLVEDLIPPSGSIERSVIEQASRVARSEPLINGRLISEDQDVAVIALNFQLPAKSNLTEEYRLIFNAVDQMVSPYREQHTDVVFRYGGDVYMNFSLGDYSSRDMQRLMPLMLLVIVSLLFVFYQSALAALLSVLLLLTSIGATMGLAGWLGFGLSSTTLVVPVVVMTLAVANAVHMTISMQNGLRVGLSRTHALVNSFNRNLRPILITMATTAAGMLTLNFSESPPFRDLGNMVALGVAVVFILTVTLLPVALWLLPFNGIKPTQTSTVETGTQWNMGRFADGLIAHYRKIIVITGLLSMVLLGFAPFNDVSDEARKYFKESSIIRESYDYMTEHVSGQHLFDVGLFSGKEGEVTSPEFLSTVDKLTHWLRQHAGVAHVYSIADTFKRLNQNIHGDDPAWYRIPEQKDLAAQTLLLYEMSLPLGLDLTNMISLDKSATRLFVVLREPGSSEVLAIEQQINEWVDQHAPELDLHMGGVTLMFSHIGEKNIPAMIKALVVAMVIISILLMVALKNWKLGFISLIPNLMPIGMGFGFWKLVSGEINLAVSVVASIAIGIVVDDTVHFLSKYQYAIKQGKSTEQAVRMAFVDVGRALITTSLVLSAGFLTLTLSDFTLLSDMGLLTAVIILLALILDLLFLPTLLLLFDRNDFRNSGFNDGRN